MDGSAQVWGRTESCVKGQPTLHDKKKVVEASSPARPRGRALASFIIDVDQELGSEDLGMVRRMMRHPKPLVVAQWLVHLTVLGRSGPKESAIDLKAATFDSRGTGHLAEFVLDTPSCLMIGREEIDLRYAFPIESQSAGCRNVRRSLGSSQS